jgi:integrase
MGRLIYSYFRFAARVSLLHCYTIMASLFRRDRSPFWWLRFREGGKWKNVSTGLRYESEEETRQAELVRAKWAIREFEESGKGGDAYSWDWVLPWLQKRCKSQRTYDAYRQHWRHIEHWIRYAGIRHPKEITFRHGHDFVDWRTGRRAGHKTCSKNTALLEVKLLGQILKFCALRGEIPSNPIQSLGIPRDEVKQKREFTDDEIGRCIKALDSEPEWMRLAFLISLYTGCRLRETRLEMKLVDFDRRTITFGKPKGGRSRAFTRPLPEALIPVLQPIRDREFSHDLPFQPSRCFQNFFGRVGVEGVSFHCLRVTYVTRLHRAGVPLSAAMRLVNHSSEVVHRIYTRLNVEDVRAFADVPLFATTPQNPIDAKADPREETPA